MTFDISQFSNLRPFLYHLTAESNVPLIQAARELRSAEIIFRSARAQDLLPRRRQEHLVLKTREGKVHIRDQKPLHAGSIDFEPGWDLDRLVLELNRLVFFWPGTSMGPNRYGWNHFARFQAESPMILRVHINDFLETNCNIQPLFARVNSGAPRCSGGRQSPRGNTTFSPAEAFAGAPSNVVEVTFRGKVILPKNTGISRRPNGPWGSLF